MKPRSPKFVILTASWWGDFAACDDEERSFGYARTSFRGKPETA